MSMDSTVGPWTEPTATPVGPDHPVFQAAQEITRGKQIMQAWADGQRESKLGPQINGQRAPAEPVKMTDQEWTDQAENYATGQPAMEFWKQHPMPSDSEQNMGWGPRQEFPADEWKGQQSPDRGGPIGNNKVEISLETAGEADEVRAQAPSIRYGGKSSNRQIPEEVLQAAKATEKKYGVPASVSAAQWALESGWGSRTPKGSNNPFGIKAVQGQASVLSVTHEFSHGRRVATQARFAKYSNLNEAFDAHGKLLATKGAYKEAREQDNPLDFAKAMAKKYATDPNYAKTLIKVMKSQGLLGA